MSGLSQVWVPFLRFGSGLGTKKVGVFPPDFRLLEPITIMYDKFELIQPILFYSYSLLKHSGPSFLHFVHDQQPAQLWLYSPFSSTLVAHHPFEFSEST